VQDGAGYRKQKTLWRWFLGIGTLFALQQVVLCVIGIQFEAYPLYSYLHFLDPELLKTRLLESCFYFHIQPPLFNLFCGVVLKCAPNLNEIVFHALYVAFGLLLCWAAFLLMCRLSISRALAFILTIVFMTGPGFILYENWLFYTLPCTLFMTISALSLFGVIERGSTWAACVFFGCLLLLSGLWSIFHLVHYVILFAVVVSICRLNRWRVMVVGLVPMLLILSLYAKNYALFGSFGPSTLLGKNLYINTVGNMGWEERQRLVADGVLSPLALINRWNALDCYPKEYQNAEGFDGIPALRDVTKSNGPHNFNHLAHIRISSVYMKDSIAAIRHSPKSFALALAVSAYNYFRPSGDYSCSFENSAKLQAWKSVRDYVLAGKLPIEALRSVGPGRVTGSPPHVFLLIGLPLLFLYGLCCAWRGVSGRRTLSTSQRWVLLYFCFNIIYVGALGVLFDFNETYRYRFTTDPFSLTILGVFVQNVVGPWFRTKFVGAKAGTESR